MTSGDLVVVEKRAFAHLQAAALAVGMCVRDKYPVLEYESAAEWLFRIVPCTTRQERVDPQLASRVSSLCHFGVSEYPAYARLSRLGDDGPLYSVALDHSWALWAWSRWLRESRHRDRGRPLLIHIDFHDDLSSPPIGRTDHPGVFVPPFGRHPVVIEDPESVHRAIARGFLGIGGFIIPFLSATGACDMMHLRSAGVHDPRVERVGIKITSRAREYLGRSVQQPEATRVAASAHSGALISLLSTDVPEALLDVRANGAVLLDIDLDYFCNRLDRGDAANAGASEKDVIRQVSALMNLVGQCEFAERIEVVTVAMSPGFFPSEYWKTSLATLEGSLLKMAAKWHLIDDRSFNHA